MELELIHLHTNIAIVFSFNNCFLTLTVPFNFNLLFVDSKVVTSIVI